MEGGIQDKDWRYVDSVEDTDWRRLYRIQKLEVDIQNTDWRKIYRIQIEGRYTGYRLEVCR